MSEFVPIYLERHAASVRPRTITTLSERLPHAVKAFGSVPLRDLERMSGELASWQAKLPERSRYGIVQALRQALEAAVRWGYTSKNPAKLAGRNRQPAPRSVRAFTRAELDADQRGAVDHLRAAADLRRCNRPSARGVAGA